MNPVNHGKIWDAAFYAELLLKFWNGDSIDKIARNIGRKKDSVTSKLANIKLGDYNLNGDFVEENRDVPYVAALITKFLRQMEIHKTNFALCYSEDVKIIALRWLDSHSDYLTAPEMTYIRFICQDTTIIGPVPQREGETEMPKFFENNYLLNGKELAKMSDSEIYAAISAEEQAIDKLRLICYQPKRLKNEILERSKRLMEFVAFIDKLDEEKIAKDDQPEA